MFNIYNLPAFKLKVFINEAKSEDDNSLTDLNSKVRK
jgi:hypothetical protein